MPAKIEIDKEEFTRLLLEEKYTNQKLADHFGCSLTPIKKRKKEWNLNGKIRPRYSTDIIICKKELEDLLLSGYTIPQLMKHFNCSEATISTNKKKFNLYANIPTPLPDSGMNKKYLTSILDFSNPCSPIWLETRNHMAKKGDKAGTITKKGYRRIVINNKSYPASHLSYLWHTGYFPLDNGEFLDHKDGIRTNNDIDNLRIATDTINAKNRCLPNNNSTGHIGVYKRQNEKFIAIGNNTSLGTFSNIEDAIFARKKFESKNGYSNRHGEVPSVIYKN